MLLINRNNLITLLFLIGYGTFFTFAMFGHFTGIGEVLKSITYVGIAILLMIFFMQLKEYSVKEGFLFFILFLWSFFISYRTEDFSFFKIALMIAVSKKIDFEKCIKFDIILRLITVVLMFYFWKLGIAPDKVSSFGSIIRHSMGFQNENHFGLLVFILSLECLYLVKFRFHFWLYLGLISLLVLETSFSRSRTAELFCSILLIFTVIYTFYPTFIEGNGWRYLFLLTPVLCTIITYATSTLYTAGIGIIKQLNMLLSGRIYNVSYFNALFGPSIFGTNIISGNRTLDNLYAYLLFSSGILVFVFVIIVYFRLIKDLYIYNNISMIIVLFFLFLYGLSERLWFQIDYNIIMLAFRQLIYHDVYIYEGES